MKTVKPIRKAIIPVAGLGTRFLPWTKNIPKEMLPILNKPTIQYIVEEVVASGITEILFITSDSKEALMSHFDRNLFLEQTLLQKDKYQQVDELKKIAKMAKIYTVRQYEPKGLGHAVLQAKNFVGDEPFALLLGDDVTYVEEGQTPVLKQMIDKYIKTNGSSILGVQEVNPNDVDKYGIIKPGQTVEEGFVQMESMIEKPKKQYAPSNLAIAGRYILDSSIFKYLEEKNVDLNTNEIQITDSILKMSKHVPVFAYTYKARRYDMGSLLGFIEANVEFAMRNPSLKEPLIELLKKEISSNKKK